MKATYLRLLPAFSALVASTTPLGAAVLFGVDWGLDSLYAFDPESGSYLATYEGIVPTDANGMAVANDGSLIIAGGSSGLHRYNPVSGLVSDPLPYAGIVDPSFRAIAATRSGRIFGITSEFPLETSVLVEINGSSGLVSEISAVPYGIQSLAASPDGMLYAWHLPTQAIHIYDQNGSMFSEVSFAESTNVGTNIQAIEFIGDRLVAHRFDVEPLGAVLAEIDLDSQTLSPIGDLAPYYSLRGLAYSSVPEPQPMLIGLIGVSVLILRRSRIQNYEAER